MTAKTATGAQVATVWRTPDGAPTTFMWDGRRFVVRSRPIPWVERIPWWEPADRAPKNTEPLVVERNMWQVQAKALDNGELLIIDLAAADGPLWSVTAVFD
ncbi:DUF6504 family protein [Kocuria sp. 2SI]|uniref:DUF6504 family protein n=1 Tax=Kocuria sp. 2SI TaxID=2502203 RepID=UPI0010F4B8F9|nr:DUF6504 family protein [Kocuria sp. 2SI]